MARKKKATKKTSQRRRRVSGVAMNANSPIMQYGPIAGGYLLADKINEAIAKVVPATLDPKIVAAAQAIGGFILRKQMKGMAGAVIGGLLMGSGVKAGLKAFNVISGVPGSRSLPVVNGYRDLRTINGLPRSVVAAGLSPSMSVISGVDQYSAYTDRD